MGPGRYNAVAVGKILLGFKEKFKVELYGPDGNKEIVEDEFLTVFT